LKRDDPNGAGSKRKQKFLKNTGNIAAYGIWAEMNRTAEETEVDLICYGKDGPFKCRTRYPEDPGEYCFPPLASLVTGGAQLLLAMHEKGIGAEASGTPANYAMEAVDSMANIATADGSMEGLPRETAAFLARHNIGTLSRSQVKAIIASFEWLNPFDRNKFPGSILGVKLDSLNRQIYCKAISINRHAFYALDEQGEFRLIREEDAYSEHTLANYLNPFNPDSLDRTWIADYWDGRSVNFGGRPALRAFPLSSYQLLTQFDKVNKAKPYYHQIKPGHYLVACSISKGLNKETVPGGVYLIRPFDNQDPLTVDWMASDGSLHRITTFVTQMLKPSKTGRTGPLLRLAGFFDQDVTWLEVAVDDAVLMGMVDTVADFGHQLQNLTGAEMVGLDIIP
jgi:hypothetical protein